MKKDHRKKLRNAAKVFLLIYFSDGKERNPSNFDEEILGRFDILSVVYGDIPQWNNTPFFYALGKLVDENKIKHRQDSDGCHWYKLNKEIKQ